MTQFWGPFSQSSTGDEAPSTLDAAGQHAVNLILAWTLAELADDREDGRAWLDTYHEEVRSDLEWWATHGNMMPPPAGLSPQISAIDAAFAMAREIIEMKASGLRLYLRH